MDKKYIKGLVEENDEVFTLVASTGTEDRQGETVNPEGWSLQNFKDNPSILWQHNASLPPIGKATRVAVEGGQLVADIVFAEKESDFAAEIARLVRGKFLNSLSVGFQPTELDDEGNSLEQELLEISVVNIPANPDARFSRAMKSFEKQEKEEAKEEVKEDCECETCEDCETKNKKIKELESEVARLEKAINTPTIVEEPRRIAIKRVNRTLRALRHIDKAVEVAIKEMKGGEKK